MISNIISQQQLRYPIMMLLLHHSSSDFSPGPQLSRRRLANHTYYNMNVLPDSNKPILGTTSSRCRPEPYGRWRDGYIAWVIIWCLLNKEKQNSSDSAKEMVGQELKEDRFVYCYPRIINLLLNTSFLSIFMMTHSLSQLTQTRIKPQLMPSNDF